MSTALSPQEAEEFANQVRTFLESNTSSGRGPRPECSPRVPGASRREPAAGIPFPKEYGGAGLTLEHERIFRQVAQGFPMMTGELVISHGMCLPVLNEFGTDEQKRKFMPDNISAKTVWCQMFSEPGAGSDVASLQTKAERDGDEWILNGQKVWTTLAHVSDYGVIIARTDPDQPKHAGISMFIIDLKSPGVEIRPINQIDGGNHFNEVFFTDVRIPADNLLGEYNNGWRQATAIAMYERVAIGSLNAGKITQPMYDVLAKWATRNGSISDSVVRDELMQIYYGVNKIDGSDAHEQK